MTEAEIKILEAELASQIEKNKELMEKNSNLESLCERATREYLYLSEKLNQIEREQNKKYPLLKDVQP